MGLFLFFDDNLSKSSGGGGTFSLDFSDATNSMYIAAIL